jgi:hypothetical protein
VEQLPPQSTSDSLPFFTRSSHAAVWQLPSVHTWLEQSPEALHAFPVPQSVVHPPPQSTSASVPFLNPSSQRGGLHVRP